MEPWCFEYNTEEMLCAVVGERKVVVNDLQPAKKAGFVKVVLASLEVLKLCIESFDYKGSSLCRNMTAPTSPGSRTLFLKRWRKYLRTETTSSNSSNDSTDSETSSSLSVTCSDNVRDDRTDHTRDPKVTVSGIQNDVLQGHFIGIFDVHVSNLCSPDASRATRVVDHEHVSALTASYQDQGCGQLVILVGMVTEDVDASSLEEPGCGCKVEILGGNHTREALQNLQRKGVLVLQTVKVKVFKNLPRTAALAIGYQHNIILHEKKKPMSFLDKVRLMRDCRQEDVTSWKDMLVMVFGEKDRRSLQHRFNLHMLMAAVCDDIWVKVARHGEVNEKFYRQLMRIKDDTLISSCMDILNNEGVNPFKKQVKQYIDDGFVRSKKKIGPTSDSVSRDVTTDTPFVESMDTTLNFTPDQEKTDTSAMGLRQELETVKEDYSALQQKCISLEDENEQLRKEIEILRGDRGSKRLRDITDEEYKPKDRVEAFWRYETGEESWLAATVLTVYADGKMIKVRYDVDNSYAKVSKSWIRKI